MRIRIDKPNHMLFTIAAVLGVGAVLMVRTLDPWALLVDMFADKQRLYLADIAAVLGVLASVALLLYLVQWGVLGVKHTMRKVKRSANLSFPACCLNENE